MASRTQLRLNQVTGSLGDASGQINDQLAALATGSVGAGSLDVVLSHLASSIKRIHGHAGSFSESAAGTFHQNLLPGADDTYDLGSAAAAWQDLHLEGDIKATDAMEIDTAAGALTIDGAAGVDLQEGGVSILNIADNRNVTVANAAAIDIDGSGAVSIDSSAGSMTVGAVLADGQTLKLGKTGAAELSLEPHATPANEKIALVNTAGTAADAVKIQAVAGTVLLDADAAASKIHLDSEGTAADGVLIESAGGIDINSTGAHPIDIESTNAAGHITLKTAHTAGVAVHIDADANAGSIVDIDAGIFDVASTGKSVVNAGGAVEVVGGAASKVVTTTGDLVVSSSAGKLILSGASGDDSVHVQSDFKVDGTFTIAGSLTVPGDLTVNGTTTTLDTTNLLVEDPIIMLGLGAQALNSNSGLLFSSASAEAGRPDVAFGRVDTNAFGLGSIANPNSGSITSVAGMTTDIAFRADSFQIAGNTNQIEIDSSNVKITAAAALELAPASKVLIGDDKKLIFGTNEDFSIEYDESVTDTVLLSGSNAIRILGNNRELQFDGNNKGIASSGTNLAVKANGAVTINATNGLIPLNDDGGPLGGASNNWSDLYLADAAVLNFGDDQDVTLTHVHDTGILLNGARQLQFGDSATRISQVADGVLHLVADTQLLMDGGGGLNTHFSGSTRIGILDGSAQAFAIQEGTNNYLAAITSNGSEKVLISQLLDVDANIDVQGSRDIIVSDSDADALEVRDASANLYLTVNSNANQVNVPDNIKLTAGTGGDLSLAHNGTDSSVENGTGIFQIRQRAAAQLIISGATELQFGDGFSGAAGMTGGVVPLAVSTAEYNDYKSNFAANRSIIGALNSLASGGTRAKKTHVVTGSHTAGVPVTIDNSLDHDGGQNPASTDVFVNGQLMLSGTAAANGDYKLHGVGADRVAFFFALDVDDVIQVVKA